MLDELIGMDMEKANCLQIEVLSAVSPSGGEREEGIEVHRGVEYISHTTPESPFSHINPIQTYPKILV